MPPNPIQDRQAASGDAATEARRGRCSNFSATEQPSDPLPDRHQALGTSAGLPNRESWPVRSSGGERLLAMAVVSNRVRALVEELMEYAAKDGDGVA
eukprot:scaffold201_cov306-Pinguiococcus_pyrenoidosus.AAC.3